MADALLSLGGNLGDPAGAIEGALGRLRQDGSVIVARSSLYRTAPWGPVAQPDFINACAWIRTELSPRELLAATKALERRYGRVPGERWGPRTLDIDILDHDGMALDEPDLVLPHPRMTERAFVLVPLAEIAADRIVAGRRVADWLAEVDRAGIETLSG